MAQRLFTIEIKLEPRKWLRSHLMKTRPWLVWVQWVQLHQQILRKTNLAPTDFEDIWFWTLVFCTKVNLLSSVFEVYIKFCTHNSEILTLIMQLAWLWMNPFFSERGYKTCSSLAWEIELKFSIFTQKDTKIRQFLSQKGFNSMAKRNRTFVYPMKNPKRGFYWFKMKFYMFLASTKFFPKFPIPARREREGEVYPL